MKYIKYILVFVVFVLAMFLGKTHNVIQRYKNAADIRLVKKEIERYEKDIEDNRRRIEELSSDKENLEKFARENCYFQGVNEDVFVVNE